MKKLTLTLITLVGLLHSAHAAEPKRLLLVTTTLGFRHSSIEIGEKTVRELAKRSGEFTVVSTSESPDYPDYTAQRGGFPGGAGGGRGGRGGGAGVFLPGLSEGQQTAVRQMNESLTPLNESVTTARAALTEAIYAATVDVADIRRKTSAVADAELALAKARADAFAKLQASANKLNQEQVTALAQQSAGGGRGGRGGGRGGGNTEQETKVRAVLAKYLSPDALKNYDGVFFLNTTGELPIPDMDAFLNWIKEGHAYIGTHSASDTLHFTPSYLALVGGEFATHGAQETVQLFNVDPKHPANAPLGPTLTVHEEMYLFKNYDRSTVHSLLNMNEHPNNKTPGHHPVAWNKEIGKGRMFYTSLGHREDIWDPEWKDQNGQRRNAPEVSEAFQKHLLGGIRWALGLAQGDSKPQAP